jgi:hypothetical protein
MKFDNILLMATDSDTYSYNSDYVIKAIELLQLYNRFIETFGFRIVTENNANDDENWEEHLNFGTDKSFLLKKVREAGFKPNGITILMCEETFIFKGSDEANKAWELFKPEGWWYDLNSWNKTREEYVNKNYYGDEELAPTIYWLDGNFRPKIKQN